MADELSDAFATLGAEADRVGLAGPDALRRVATVRRRRDVAAISAVVIAVVAVVAGVAFGGRHDDALPPGATVPVPTSSPVTVSPSAPPVTRSPGGACTAADLAYVSSTSDGAMGSTIVTVVVRNTSSTPCRVQGPPELAAAGAAVPTRPDCCATPVTVVAGGEAGFDVRYANGTSGFDPAGPACAHPATYTDLVVVLLDGSRITLDRSLSLVVQCGDIRVAGWRLPPF